MRPYEKNTTFENNDDNDSPCTKTSIKYISVYIRICCNNTCAAVRPAVWRGSNHVGRLLYAFSNRAANGRGVSERSADSRRPFVVAARPAGIALAAGGKIRVFEKRSSEFRRVRTALSRTAAAWAESGPDEGRLRRYYGAYTRRIRPGSARIRRKNRKNKMNRIPCTT